MEFTTSLDFAKQADSNDPLRSFRKKFRIPERNGTEQIYFLGNSLGLQPIGTAAALNNILEQWAHAGVESFFIGEVPWLKLHASLQQLLSPIAGALPSEIVVMNQLTVNLHLMMTSFYRPQGKRNKIVCERPAFPSDRYMLHSYLRHLGLRPEDIIIEVAAAKGEVCISIDQMLHVMEEHENEVALIFWGGVNYYTGQYFDLAEITSIAHDHGAMAGFDLAHAIGNVELKLHDWNVDFACWCSYKYLNAGPGAIAGAYIHERYHHDQTVKRLAGWWGNDESSRFSMLDEFQPSPSAEGWQLSTPSIVLYAMLKSSLEIFQEAQMPRLLEKGSHLSSYLIFLLNDILNSATDAFRILTPKERGCQVSVAFAQNGKKIFADLTAQGIFADWREPDVIRIAPVPLYNSYEEVWTCAQIFRKLILT